MKCLIILENHFYLDSKNKIWCDRVVDYEYLKRYLNVFDKILVTGRTQKIEFIEGDKLLVSGENVEFYPLPDFKGAKGLLCNIIKIRKSIRKLIKKCDCAIYRAPTHLSIFTYKEIIKNKKPLAFEFMMAANKMFDGDSLIKKTLNRIIDNKAKKMLLKANGVSYVTEYILQKKYPCKAIINPNDKKYFTNNYSSIDLTKDMYYEHKWKKNDKPKIFNIIHVGYMDSYRKGQKVLLEAFKILVDKGYNLHLTLIGDGEKKKEFEILAKNLNIEDRITFTGLIKDKKTVLDYLKKSHLFVFPTQSEGLPRVIIEAMSQGLPCIASPVDGIPELIKDDFLVDFYDVQGYANKIERFINNWTLCCEESKHNYYVSLKYEKYELSKKREEFYNQLKKCSIEGSD